jgi:CxxC motif-containing protein (DUF1111 family)
MTRSRRRWFGSGASAWALVALAACGRHPLTSHGDANGEAPADSATEVPSGGGGDAAAGAPGGDAATDTPGGDAATDTPSADAPSEAPGPDGATPDAPTDGVLKSCTADPGSIDLGRLAPLFSAADAKNPPIVFTRPDGVIVTRGAGRFRGRHEKEGSFGLYIENTFLDPGFGFTLEDFTPLGQQRIRVTYLPYYKPMPLGNRMTNFRHWKVQGNNATFMLNDYLVDVPPPPPVEPTAPFGGIEQYDEMKVPAGRTMAVGENYEFELTAFIPPSSPPRRDTYYTDTFRYRIGLGGLTPNNRDYPALAGPLPPAQLGGDTTIAWLLIEPYMYYEQTALNIQHENLQGFLEGRRLFYTDFTTGSHLERGNVAFPEQAGKAGPLFNAPSCETCHFRNGSGAWDTQANAVTVTQPTGTKASLQIKLFDAGSLGDRLQAQEGTVTVTGMDTKTVVLADGTSVALHRPKLAVVANGAAVTRFSARIPRPLVGLGLLEALDERALVALSDRLDCDKDSISGRPSVVEDPALGVLRFGRFGWKAEKVSVAHQVADDASANLGVTTSPLPGGQTKPELSDADLARLTTYLRLLGVPPQRNADDPQVRGGAQLFQAIGCAACHRTDLLTSATHPFAELRNQAVKPFTDLLLHDMGPDLADDSGVPAPSADDSPASASEWRTPPLWGVGLAKTVNPSATFLHDGRAADLQEAILWHGGEAERAQRAYVALSAEDRAALLAFVQSL